MSPVMLQYVLSHIIHIKWVFNKFVINTQSMEAWTMSFSFFLKCCIGEPLETGMKIMKMKFQDVLDMSLESENVLENIKKCTKTLPQQCRILKIILGWYPGPPLDKGKKKALFVGDLRECISWFNKYELWGGVHWGGVHITSFEEECISGQTMNEI